MKTGATLVMGLGAVIAEKMVHTCVHLRLLPLSPNYDPLNELFECQTIT
jgi:hypothetical protein